MIDLIETAVKLAPSVPAEAFTLNPYDRNYRKYSILIWIAEWDDDMTYPTIQYERFTYQAAAFGVNLVSINLRAVF